MAPPAVGADVDLVSSYLRDIGRVPLLTNEQEITLGRQVQGLMVLESLEQELEIRIGGKPSFDDLAKATGLTFSEMGIYQKQKISHRALAFQALIPGLKTILNCELE